MLLSTFQAQTDIYEETLEKLASEFSIPFIQIYEPLCDSIGCSMISNQTILYRDNDHLNILWSMMIGKYLSGQLKEHLPLY